MTDIEIARLVTAIIISAMVSYAIGFIMSYMITWHSAVEIFNGYRLAIVGYKNVIQSWKEMYDATTYTMMGTYDLSLLPDEYFSEQEVDEMLKRIE